MGRIRHTPKPDNLILIPRPHGGRRELNTPSCPLTSTHMPCALFPKSMNTCKNSKNIKY